jgi:tetratricopeptide (TPR) repeat protein
MQAARIVIAIVLLGASVAVTGADHVLSRRQALAQVSSADVKERRAAVERLGTVGVMSDARVLVKALHDPDEATRELAEASIWRVWSRSGDAEVDELFERGAQEMATGALDSAIETFTIIIRKKPDFAEGWNKRATLYFMAGELDKSLKDCDEVLKRNPDHFGVLAGYGQIYLQLDEPQRALEYFQRALTINPNMDAVAATIEGLKRYLNQRRSRII